MPELGPLKGIHLESFRSPLKRYNIWNGAVSSGKTYTTLFKFVDFCITGPPGEILLVGKTERTLERNVIDPLIKIFGRGIRKVGSNLFVFGRRCYIVGANDERAEQKIRGISLVCAYCDELTLFPESFWQMLITRLRLKDAALIGTTNPDSPAHYLKESFMENPGNKDKLNIWFSTMDDNPYLEPGYVADMKSAYPESSLWYKRYILGLWVAAEGVVYDMWDPAKHVKDKTDLQGWSWYIGIDYGTNNPCVFLMIGVHNKEAYCAGEYYYDSSKTQKQKTDAEYADDLVKFIGKVKCQVILDPSALSFKVELRKRGVTVRDADNSVLDGIRTTARLITGGQYHVNKCCVNHIKEFSSYVWDERSQKLGEDRPMKANDHSMDACRYVLHTVMGKGEVRAIRI
jgi:PBSX family phage terminase large subunit